MSVQRTYVSAEFADGTVHDSVRIVLVDQLAWSKTARINKLPVTDQGLASAFMAWHALHRLELYPGTWDEFSAGGCIDLEISHDDDEPGEAGSDPTTA